MHLRIKIFECSFCLNLQVQKQLLLSSRRSASCSSSDHYHPQAYRDDRPRVEMPIFAPKLPGKAFFRSPYHMRGEFGHKTPGNSGSVRSREVDIDVPALRSKP